MIIDAHNVILRAIEESDLPFLQRMINDPQIERMTVGGAFLFLQIGKRGGLNLMTSKRSFES